MDINRENYMLWITDYYDGVLDDRGRRRLLDFLDGNPDLREEFEQYESFNVPPQLIAVHNNDFLKKDTGDLSDEQVDRFVIAMLEGDLTSNQEEEINDLVINNARFAEAHSIYKNIKLTPPGDIYNGKSSLRRIPYRKTIRRIGTWSLSAAASVAIIIGLLTFIPGRGSELPVAQDSSPNLLSSWRNGEDMTGVRIEITLSNIKPALALVEERETDRKETREISETPDIQRESVKIEPIAINSNIVEAGNTNLMNMGTYSLPGYYPDNIEPSSPRQFIASEFRKIVLGDSIAGTDRLKVYEVADAGIRGINRLLGWNMNLEKEISNEGTLDNLKFTSQLLNFEHKPKNADD